MFTIDHHNLYFAISFIVLFANQYSSPIRKAWIGEVVMRNTQLIVNNIAVSEGIRFRALLEACDMCLSVRDIPLTAVCSCVVIECSETPDWLGKEAGLGKWAESVTGPPLYDLCASNFLWDIIIS